MGKICDSLNVPAHCLEKFPLNVIRSWEKSLEAALIGQRSQRHNGNFGVSLEREVRNCIRRYLPDEYSIGSGEIRSPYQDSSAPSPQADIVIYRREYPRIQMSEDIYAYIPESVLAIIEVKAKLTKPDVVKFYHDCVAWKSVVDGTPAKLLEQRPALKCFLFALSGPSHIGLPAKWLHGLVHPEAIKGNPELYAASRLIDSMCIMGCGAIHRPVGDWTYWQDDFRNMKADHTLHDFAVITAKELNLAMLLFLLLPDRHIAPECFVSFIRQNCRRILFGSANAGLVPMK